MTYYESAPPADLAGALARTEEIFARSSHTLEGTRPDGPGAAALHGLAYAVEALRHAQQAVYASGEGGI